MNNAFLKAYAFTLGVEGGFKKDAKDHMDWTSGKCGEGELRGTKFGISAGSYPTLDIENLTLEQAQTIYYNDFWLPLKGDDLEPHVAGMLFDADVNHGMGNGVRMMQRALDVADDGRIGPITLGTLKAMDPQLFMMKFMAERLIFFTKCSTWIQNSKGWSLRIAANLKQGAGV